MITVTETRSVSVRTWTFSLVVSHEVFCGCLWKTEWLKKCFNRAGGWTDENLKVDFLSRGRITCVLVRLSLRMWRWTCSCADETPPVLWVALLLIHCGTSLQAPTRPAVPDKTGPLSYNIPFKLQQPPPLLRLYRSAAAVLQRFKVMRCLPAVVFSSPSLFYILHVPTSTWELRVKERAPSLPRLRWCVFLSNKESKTFPKPNIYSVLQTFPRKLYVWLRRCHAMYQDINRVFFSLKRILKVDLGLQVYSQFY